MENLRNKPGNSAIGQDKRKYRQINRVGCDPKRLNKRKVSAAVLPFLARFYLRQTHGRLKQTLCMQVDPSAGFQFNWGHCYSIYVTCPAGRAMEWE